MWPSSSGKEPGLSWCSRIRMRRRFRFPRVTTRRSRNNWAGSPRRLLYCPAEGKSPLADLDAGGDIVNGVVDGLDAHGVLVGDLQAKLLLEVHDQFDGVERIGAEVHRKAGSGRDFFFRKTECVGDDVDDFLFDNSFFHFFRF